MTSQEAHHTPLTVTVITPVFNAQETIQATVASVQSQDYPHVEHLVVDGGSTDGTVAMVREVATETTRLVSEPDDGIYDAMNKGIRMANGQLIGILNADDVFAAKTVVRSVVEASQRTDADIVYGDVDLVDPADLGRTIRHWRAGEHKPGSFARGWHPPHPGVFVRNSLYRTIGAFDPEYRVAGDFEFLLRAFEHSAARVEYLPIVMVKMRLGGTSTGSFSNIIKGNLECIRAFRKQGTSVGPLYVFRRILPKLAQYLRYQA